MADPTPTPSPPKIPWFNLAAVGLLACLIIGSAVWQKLPTPPQPIPPAPLPEPDKNKPVIIPEKVQVDVGDWADVTAKSLGPVMWLVPPPLSKSAKVNENTLTFLGRKEGEYWVGANTVLEGKETVPTWVMVTVGKVKPMPPDPDPTPPDPKPPGPKPDPAPIPIPGFRVLFIYETADLGKYPREQQAVLTAQEIRTYLDAKCAKGADGKTPERRFWDKDQDLSKESKLWQDAFQRKGQTLPWLIISNGVSGYEGPVPANISETMKLLKKFGGE